MDILLVFRTRNQTLRAANFLRSAGYNASVVDTPLRISGSCTLSVRCDRGGLGYFYQYAQSFPSLLGAYSVTSEKYARIF